MNLSIIISIISLAMSALTFWLTRIKKGEVKMTRPTIIFFGPDGEGEKHNKIFIRTLLFSTSDKGQYIQNMFIRLKRGESDQDFNGWIYDDKGLVRGSGLFISKEGIVLNHHFLLPKAAVDYSFLPGDYVLQVFIEPINKNPKLIFEQELKLSNEQSDKMKAHNAGTYFDWVPDTQSYLSTI